MNLRDVFIALAHKRLATVDLAGRGSHQHEINGSAALRSFFKDTPHQRTPITWTVFSDKAEPEPVTGTFTFYDARAKSANRTGRSEWRFYYSGEPLATCSPEDLLVIGRTKSGDVQAMAFEKDSGWERAALKLFPVTRTNNQMSFLPMSRLDDTRLDVVRRAIFERLGIEYLLPEREDLTDVVIREFGLAFPSTARMGLLARSMIAPDDPDPDSLLLNWMDMEEQLFRTLEKLIVGEKVEAGFTDVDEFLAFSLSVQNRRKSRMGHAFEHHLAALFDLNSVRYSRQVRTEGNRTADFIFPSASAYHDPEFPESSLMMLAAKSTCKDRWPQVLADADRVPIKHLGTLDTAISRMQMRDMAARGIVPVMPARLGELYAPDDRILTFKDFIRELPSGATS